MTANTLLAGSTISCITMHSLRIKYSPQSFANTYQQGYGWVEYLQAVLSTVPIMKVPRHQKPQQEPDIDHGIDLGGVLDW